MGTDDDAIWERTWHRARGPVVPSLRFIFEEIQRHVRFEGKEVLELGCGKGSLSYLALKAGARHVTLLDFSERALALARALFGSKPPEMITYAHENLLHTNLGKTFDIVMSSGVAEHFVGSELEACVRQHVRHCRDKVVICVPSDTVFNRLRSSSPQNIALYGFWRPVPDTEMRKLLEREGTTVVHNRRFRVTYGAILPARGLRGMSLVRQLVSMSLRPLERWLGGLLLAIGQVGERVPDQGLGGPRIPTGRC